MKRSLLLLTLLAAPFAAFAQEGEDTLSDSAATYYVSPEGDDEADGLSPENAWRSLGRVNAHSFVAGEQVLLEGGATFTDTGLRFLAEDVGSATNPIVVGSYGEGRAIIKPAGDVHPIEVYNTAGIVIENLVLEGVGRDSSSKAGVSAFVDLPGDTRIAGLTIRGCEMRELRFGINIGAWATDGSFSGFADVLIEHNLVHTILEDGIFTYGMYPGSETQQSHRNIIIRDCEVHGVTGNPGKTTGHSGSGIIMSGVIGGLIDRCYAHHNGGSAGTRSGGGPVGIWTWGSDSVTIQRSLVHDQRTTPGVKDGGGFDIDGGATNAVIQYCYSYNNEGSGYLMAAFAHGPPIKNATFRYNISWRDGRRIENDMAAGFHFWKGAGETATITDVKVYNNLVYTEKDTGGPAVVWQSGPMSGIRFWNNVFVVKGGERFVDIDRNWARNYFDFQNNVYWAVDGDYSGGWVWGDATFHTLDDWRQAPRAPEMLGGQPVGLMEDPRIVDLVEGAQPKSVAEMKEMPAFRLLVDSPLRNAGLDLRTPAFGSIDVGEQDFFGGTIPSGDDFDIGPHERETSLQKFRDAHNLAPDGADDFKAAAGDGVSNLLKYAFNLIGSEPGQVESITARNRQLLSTDGVAGWPSLVLEDGEGGAGLAYIRRRSATHPQIGYEVWFAETLEPNAWGPSPDALEEVTPIDDTFERVVVSEAPHLPPRRFARVVVTREEGG